MSYDLEKVEEIIHIYRILNQSKDWCPAVQIIQDHEGDAIWVAALMYNIYARYLETVPDSEQNLFETNVKDVLSVAFDHGMEYIDTIKDREK